MYDVVEFSSAVLVGHCLGRARTRQILGVGDRLCVADEHLIVAHVSWVEVASALYMSVQQLSKHGKQECTSLIYISTREKTPKRGSCSRGSGAYF